MRVIPLHPTKAPSSPFFRRDPKRHFALRFHATRKGYRAALKGFPGAADSDAVFVVRHMPLVAQASAPLAAAFPEGLIGSFHFVAPFVDDAHFVHEAVHASARILASVSCVQDIVTSDADEFLAQSTADLFVQIRDHARASPLYAEGPPGGPEKA